ncbi:kinesin motor domain-containing protein [Polychytrium aggregatum]|uniref:kinesin motor domain-containing protein n=1 Tax=Polychytrium aggregatum TaxID=110093 RepID=UPI0022FE8024|nr:kinesin motor domain-containing protein [Polychytrium aggregatum]KAI9204997.1 kinesin motor domain-containing protein [Polychytrium aggregatum]
MHTHSRIGLLARTPGCTAGTIFAYGQTSSGKTYTMKGSENSDGIISMAIMQIFQTVIAVRSLTCSSNRDFLLRVSYLEIYNEVIKDLLNPENSVNLKIQENPQSREMFIKGLTELSVGSLDEIDQCLRIGEANRHVGETNINEFSSRSHTIFRIVSSGASLEDVPSAAVKVSTLNLVDLAGSERVGHTGAEGVRLKEGGHINKSLLALGNVIKKLTEEGSAASHVPYRDSKLTRILQSSLGGNARTSIICTVTPAAAYIDETHSTLKFAGKAKQVKNKPEVNEVR